MNPACVLRRFAVARAPLPAALALLIAAAAWLAVALPAAAAPPPPAPEFRVPRPVSRTLANGLVVQVFEDHRLPAVHYRLLVKAGARDEPAAKAGEAALAAAVMRQGTATLSAQELSAKIDYVGGSLSIDADRDYTMAAAEVRTPDRDLALTLLADVAMRPAFAEEEVGRMRSQTQAAIRQSRDDPGTVADDHLVALIHGRHPYARAVAGDEQSVGGLTRDDLIAFHRTYWRPNNTVLAVAGDVTAAEVFAAAERAFGAWEPGDVPVPAEAAPAEMTASRVRLLDKPDLSQSQIRMGYVGPPRSTPDYFPLLLMNYVLGGGGFASRLVSEVRAKAGLTYDVDTRWNFGADRGTFAFSTFTKNESVKQALDLALEVISRFRDQGPTPDELAKAKAFYLGVFPFGFQTPGDVAEQWLRAGFYDLGDDYFDRYRERVRAVTAEDVRRVAGAYLRTAPANFVVVGRAETVAPQLSDFGAAETLAFTARTGAIPEVAQVPPPALAPATPESRQQAAAVVGKALRAHGGAAVLKAIRGWRTRGTVTLAMGQMSLDGEAAEYVQLPARRRVEMLVMGKPMVQVTDDDTAWVVMNGEPMRISAEQVEDMRAGAYANPVQLLRALAEPQADIRYVGRLPFASQEAEAVEWVRAGGRAARVYFDAASGELMALEQPELSPTGVDWVPVQRAYGDYRLVGKVRYPYRVIVYSSGVKMVETALTEIEFNPTLGAELFRRPGH